MSSYVFPVIIENLTKIFPPGKVVLDNIDLSVVNGETIGILGNNGAGKTTLLRIIATMLYPSSGLVEIFGLNPRVDANKIKFKIGYLPERFSFYPYYTVDGILDFFERLIPEKTVDLKENREKVIKLLGLDSYLQSRIKTLSKGMLHKVGLAITLIHDPPLLLLDEPTSGLDPLIRTQVRRILLDITKDFDKTVLFSSHILEDVEMVCDRVFMLENGKMLHEPIWFPELRKKLAKLTRLEARHEGVNTPDLEIEELDNVLYHNVNNRIIEIYCRKESEKEIIAHTVDLLGKETEIRNHSISLEDIYLLNHARVDWMDFLS